MIRQFPRLVNASYQVRSSNDQTDAIFVTCHCLEDTYQVGPCEVRVFIRNFSINLSLTAGRSLTDTWYAKHESPSQIGVKFEHSETDEKQRTLSDSIGAVAGSDNKLTSTTQASNSQGRSINTKLNYEAHLERISVGGTAHSVTWQFKCAPHEQYFAGAVLNDVKITNVEAFDRSNTTITLEIPKYGVFASPGRSQKIREMRAYNIFALVVRKKISGVYEIDAR